MARSAISPFPAIAIDAGLPWDLPIDDPVAAIAAVRADLGDTFVIDSGPDRYLFTFSPVGVASFYALPEDLASKGLADWRMLRRKVPDDVFADRRTLPHQLFGRDDVAGYLTNVERALDATVTELGDAGQADVFALTRRLGHRLGLASWGGPGAADGARFDRMATALDALDGAEAFVHPDAMAAVAASDHATERAALAVLVEEVTAILGDLPGAEADHPLFARVAAAWADEPPETRRQGVAYDVALVHIASMSNLFAALGWMLIDLVDHPDEAARVAAGDRVRTEQVALESTRLAQRSIMARYVVAPVSLDVGGTVHQVEPRVTIATLLPLTNTTAAPGLDGWRPDRWNRRRLGDTPGLAAPELVTVFGHGHHTCPAQPFSLAVMTAAAARLFAAFDLEPGWTERPGPVKAQIGGVARAAEPCPVSYRRRRG